MNTSTQSRVRRIFTRITRTYAELDYAQRRLLEVQTGVPNLTRAKRATARQSVSEHPVLYAPEADEMDVRRVDTSAI